jgi:dTDP-4-amino-4,6-dideoxygalactose transaminase
MADVVEYCRARRIALIEDCAHCFFGRTDIGPIGTAGDYAIGSLPKFFPVTEGGLLASNRHAIGARLPSRRNPGPNLRAAWDILEISSRYGRLNRGAPVVRAARELVRTIRRNSEPLPRDATIAFPEQIRAEALADRLLPPIPIRMVDAWVVSHTDHHANITRRQRNFDLYSQRLRDTKGATPTFTECPPGAAPYVFPLRVDQPQAAYARMRAAGLPVFRWDRLWPGASGINDDVGSDWASSLIQFACHQSLGASDIEAICEAARLQIES